ncbi:MAG TPA: CxxC-x17-CxxC domain-containing protein [Planctomycetota bacterium]|nr:CxxC-x17-CxxC domain-containing protein [Planctomycetota bacterium]
MPEQSLTCSDCQKTFAFTDQEQAFFQERGFAPPKRCPECRKARRARQGREGGGGGGGGGGGFRPGGKPRGHGPPRGGGGGFSREDRGGGWHSPRPARPSTDKFRIVCDGCGQEASVPFEPAAGRPVYCQACYRDRKGR